MLCLARSIIVSKYTYQYTYRHLGLILKGENKNAFYLLARKRLAYGGNVISKDEEISMCGDFYATGQCISECLTDFVAPAMLGVDIAERCEQLAQLHLFFLQTGPA
jgi:hypothetical protein